MRKRGNTSGLCQSKPCTTSNGGYRKPEAQQSKKRQRGLREYDRPHQLPYWPSRACGLCPASCVAGWGCGMTCNLAHGVSARCLTRGPGDTGRLGIKSRGVLCLYHKTVRRSGATSLDRNSARVRLPLSPYRRWRAGMIRKTRRIAVGSLRRTSRAMVPTGRLLPAGFDSLARV